MICVVKDCGNEIHPERLAVRSTVIITCSKACSEENDREQRRQGRADTGNATRRMRSDD